MTLSSAVQRRAWWRQPSFLLLLVLLLSLALYPFAGLNPAFRAAALALDVVVVLFVVRVIRAHETWMASGWVIAVPTVILQLWQLLAPDSSVELAMWWCQVLFHGYAILALLSYVLRDPWITLDELFAIAATYVLIALLWASAYAIVVHSDPAAIFINPTNNLDGRVDWPDLVYYSMTTLSSTGYGEITPVSPAARALAMLQQVVGVLFVAILVARLTGLYRKRD